MPDKLLKTVHPSPGRPSPSMSSPIADYLARLHGRRHHRGAAGAFRHRHLLAAARRQGQQRARHRGLQAPVAGSPAQRLHPHQPAEHGAEPRLHRGRSAVAAAVTTGGRSRRSLRSSSRQLRMYDSSTRSRTLGDQRRWRRALSMSRPTRRVAMLSSGSKLKARSPSRVSRWRYSAWLRSLFGRQPSDFQSSAPTPNENGPWTPDSAALPPGLSCCRR